MNETGKACKYYGIVFLLKAVALLPLWVLYPVSGFISFFIHRVVKYRVDVVRKNLRNSFPEKSEGELRKIEAEFYRHLCDCIVESIKLLHISDQNLMRRVALENTALIESLVAEGKPIILFMGHYGNWEWVPALTLSMNEPRIMGALYKPLHNKVMDRVMRRIRSRFRSICIPSKEAYRTLIELKNSGLSFMIGFIADQRPLGNSVKHWTTFLGRPTAYFAGGETIGDRVGAAYVYVDITRRSRGHYCLAFREMKPAEGDNAEYPYTRTFFRMLEQTIRRAPAFWLWSHNRWAAKPPVSEILSDA